MPRKRIKTLHHKLAASLALLLTLAACGGGGSSDGASEPASTTATPAVVAAATLTALVPGAGMNWATAGDRSVSLTVQAADGQPAAGAALRIFALSRTSPQDGSALEEPVPMSLMDTVVTDATGHASLTLQWPGHVDELLAVATMDDTHGRAVLTANGVAAVVLQLAR